ncbi:hypothetical protein Tco_0909303 [Tanacetum coccineum]|uniref:Reverse transcriptase domain-containing protein n=1 Tax=Tanacetum coccineum TaxID=301880 RepID=A0ABQ5CRQ9_9ASTR
MKNQGNNQNCYNQNRGNFNQAPAYQPPVYQGQVYRPQVVQPPAYQAPAYQAPAPQIQGVSKEDFHSYVKANDAVMRNMQTQGQNMQNQLTNLTDMLSKFVASNTASTSGTLPSNTVTNPKEDLKVGNLSLSELTPTCMTLELADRSISEPIGIAEDVYVTVGKFQFPADFRSRRFLNQRGPLIQSGPNFEVTQPTTIIDATELTSLIWLVKNTLKKFLVLKCDLEWQSHPYCVPIGSTSSHP